MDPDTFMLYFFLVILYVLFVFLTVLFYHTNIPITAAVVLGAMTVVIGVIFATRSFEIGILIGVLLAASILPLIPKR